MLISKEEEQNMSKAFGGIELGGAFGGYEIVNEPADKLPQDLATAIGNVNSGLLGATYQPIWYVGHQLVNGTNHFLICKEIRSTKDKNTSIVGLVVNIPPGTIDGEGASVVEIIEEAKLSPEIQAAFETAEKQLVGVSYKPIAYVGSQVVRGVNHFIICQAKGIYPGAEPYPVVMVINIFDGNVSIVNISGLLPEKGNLFGYAFNW